MNKILAVISFILAMAMIIFAFPEGPVAALVTAFSAAIIILIIRNRISEDQDFLIGIFLIALIARIVFGLFLHTFDLRDFFGGDALTYDAFGYEVTKMWFGISTREVSDQVLNRRLSDIGYGMLYLVAGLYSIIGRNILAAQSLCAVIGAATAPLVYICSYRVFNNRRVGQIAAILTAVFPAFIIWTGQLMKDGLVIFFLVLVMVTVLNLQKKFSISSLILLLVSILGIISLRFYVFYMVAVAIVGTFIVGFSNTPQSIFRRAAILVLLGLGLTYMGVLRYAGSEFERYGNLERIQNARQDLAGRAESGFGEDIDVRTTEGAITAIPLGLTYLMLAPFPWQATNFRQAITLPEVLIWWAMIPLIISGIWYAARNRLRNAIPILIFTIMLSIAYSLFQGNVGTAYRQRTQIQVFLFIFAAVGWTLRQEQKENRLMQKNDRQRRQEKFLRERRENNEQASENQSEI